MLCLGLLCRLRPFSKACCSSIKVERSQRLCVFPKYFSTQGRIGIGGTHWDMASTKQFRALGWQSLWAWWLPLHRKGLSSPDKAWRGNRGLTTTTDLRFTASALIQHSEATIQTHFMMLCPLSPLHLHVLHKIVNNNFYWTDERNRNASIAFIANVRYFYLDHGVTALIILIDRDSAINDTLVMNIIVTVCDKME